jgi:hypothetical protein
MSRAATRDELLALISSRLADVEEAIHQHTDDTVSVFEEGRRSFFLAGQERGEETDWSRGIDLSLEELAMVHHYLFANAFISAWTMSVKTKCAGAKPLHLRVCLFRVSDFHQRMCCIATLSMRELGEQR